MVSTSTRRFRWTAYSCGSIGSRRLRRNIAAATMLLRDVPEPINPQEQAVYRNLRALVEATAVQQEESSAS